jgi:hypothetical protein
MPTQSSPDAPSKNPGTSAPVPAPEPTGTAPPSGSSTDGALLGSYTFDLAAGYAVALGPTKPTHWEPDTSGYGDLEKSDAWLQLPGTQDTMEMLPDDSTPTYQSCVTATDSTPGQEIIKGFAFCIIEPDGLIAGGKVTGLSSNDAMSSTATIQIFVWRHAA